MRPLLVSKWENVLVVSWGIPDELLVPSVPAGLRLDRVHGKAMVSLVCATIDSVSTWGIRWPKVSAVPAIGLAFYVRDTSRRGICLLGGYLGNGLLGGAARWLFREPAQKAELRRTADGVDLARGDRTHRVTWRAEGDWVHPGRDTPEHLLLERRFVFAAPERGKTRMIRFEHPIWRVRERVAPDVDVDFGALWGPQWDFLRGEVPRSVLLAEGSDVGVYPARAWDGGADERRIPATV